MTRLGGWRMKFVEVRGRPDFYGARLKLWVSIKMA